MKLQYFIFYCTAFCFLGCVGTPKKAFDKKNIPPPPDYSNLDYWSAHPDKEDLSDLVPIESMKRAGSDADIDVFFIHPTTYSGKFTQKTWNADLAHKALNENTDERPIMMQSTIFNGAGQVFAPRYRQAHLRSFYVEDGLSDANKAFKIAYADVKAAFLHYMKNENKGKGIILATHSQGAKHGKRLLKELFDGKALQNQLVAAYLIGWKVEKNYFKNISVCTSADQIGCFCSWRTYERKFGKKKGNQAEMAVTNPLSWTTEENFVSRKQNKGGVLLNFNRIEPQCADAEIYKGYLLSKHPKAKYSFFIRKRNYHIADLNLYYVNVRENAELRAATYLKAQQ